MTDEKKTGDDKAATHQTGAATGRAENSNVGEGDKGETREGPGGFSYFRDWANKRLSEGREVRIFYDGKNWPVEEITPYGELRLKVEGSFALVPFADRNIAEFLRQIL